MKNNQLYIRIDDELKQQIVTLAKQERRQISDQAGYLIEQGLKAIRRHHGLNPDGYPAQQAQSGVAR